MHVGYIVGIIISTSVLLIGIIGLILSKRKNQKNKWPFWAVLFGVCALISAAINSGVFIKLF